MRVSVPVYISFGTWLLSTAKLVLNDAVPPARTEMLGGATNVMPGRNDDEDIRRKIKGETGTDVSFITIQELLFLLVKKLQNWDFDLDRIREIFQREGLISKDVIQDIIGR